MEPISATLAIVGPLLAAAKGALTMFEKQATRQRQGFDAVEDLRIAIDRLKSDASMYETLLSTMIAPEMDHQPAIDLCNSVKGNEALSELDDSLKAAKLLLEQDQMTSISKVPASIREKRETVVKRPPIRELIHSFLKANVTLEDETIHNMNDTTRDLDVCRKNCDRAFKLLWHLYMIYQQRPNLQRRASQESITIESGELSRALDEVKAAFYRSPFSLTPEEVDWNKYGKVDALNSSHDASNQHQRLMKTLGEAWVQERMDRETFQEATGRMISKVQWLGGLQTTLFELLWSGMIEQLKRHNLENPNISSDPDKMDIERGLGELERNLQKAIMRAKEQRFTMAFCGMVKAGKSLFLNALIGEPILPSDELPSTAWPCRLRHVPGQTEPELTYNDGPFKSGIQALQRAQYGRKLENYQPPSDNPFDFMFGEEPQEPTLEEVQIRELYASWVDLHAATRRSLRDFEQSDFQLAKSARGHGPVKKLLSQLNDVVRLCHRFKLGFQVEGVDWPLLTVEFNSLRGIQINGIYELIDLPGLGESFDRFDFEILIRHAAKDSNAIVPIVSFKELARSDWRRIPEIIEGSSGRRASFVVCTHLDQIHEDNLTEQLATVSKVFWPQTGIEHSNIIACSSLMGLSARTLLDLSRDGKPKFEDFWDESRKKVEYPCAEKILGTALPEEAFSRMNPQSWKVKLEVALEASGIPGAINRLIRELADQANYRVFMFELGVVHRQIQRVRDIRERWLLGSRRTPDESNNAMKEHDLMKGKLVELFDLAAGSEVEMIQHYQRRLDSGIHGVKRVLYSKVDDIIRTIHGYSSPGQSDRKRNDNSLSGEDHGFIEIDINSVLVFNSKTHIEDFLQTSQRYLQASLRQDENNYTDAVKTLVGEAITSRLKYFKTKITAASENSPLINLEICTETKAGSWELSRPDSPDISLKTLKHLIMKDKVRHNASTAIKAIEDKLNKSLISSLKEPHPPEGDTISSNEIVSTLRGPINALATISYVVTLPKWRSKAISETLYVSFDAIATQYKQSIIDPRMKQLQSKGEEILKEAIKRQGKVTKLEVFDAVGKEARRFKLEVEEQTKLAANQRAKYWIATISNLWAAEGALFLIQRMFKENLSATT